MATLGYVRSSNGPDLAQVGAGEQLVSHVIPNTSSEPLRLTHVSAWVGNWGGQARIRFGVWTASSSSAAPGALLGQTVEGLPSVNYVDAAGGQLLSLALETPIDLDPGQVVCLGIASRSSAAGIAMYQAADISQPNENFYRKSYNGEDLTSNSGATASNEGQLAIYVTGETNVAPNAPDIVAPIGLTTGDLTPVITVRHHDPDGNRTSRVQVQVRNDALVTIWSHSWDASIADGAVGNIAYAGPALLFYSDYAVRARTMDSHGEWGTYSGWQGFSVQHVNRSPLVPNGFTGVGTLAGTLSTTVSANFQDPDYPELANGQEWERFEQKQGRLVRDSDNVVVYNRTAINTTTSERANARSSTAITLPAYDTLYRWEERHRDRRGAWGPYSDNIQLLARSGGSADLPSSPTGRVTDPANPGTVRAIYRNSGTTNAQSWRIGLFNSAGSLLAQSPIFSPAGGVPPDTEMAASWSSTGFGTLENDTVYGIAVRVLVSPATGWSAWSTRSGFTTNAAPNTPRLYGPPDGVAMSYLPTTSVRASDPDQASSQLTVEAEIYDADTDTLITAYALPHLPSVSGGDVFGKTLTSEVPGYGHYKFRARSFDGFLYSPWSPEWEFTYAALPEVTITAPTGPTVSTSVPTFYWTATGQTAWRFIGRNEDGDIVYDTGIVNNASVGHVLRSEQFWIGDERWNNHETLYWSVQVQDASTLWGESETVVLTLEYIPPDPLVITSVEAKSFAGVRGTHYAEIVTTQPNALEEDFIRTVADRVEIDGPDGSEIAGTMQTAYFEAGSTSATLFEDFDMTSGQWYRWAFRYEVLSGVDVISSDPVYAEMMVSWNGTLLHMPFDPINNWVWLPYGEERYEPEAEWFQGHSGVMTINGRAPIGYSNTIDRVDWRIVSTLVPREGATPEQQRDAFRRMWKYQNKRFAPNGRPNSVCLREGRGGDDSRVYGRISDPRRRHSYTRLYTIEFLFQELEELPTGGAQ